MNIAITAHDAKKELMVQFCIAYCGILSRYTPVSYTHLDVYKRQELAPVDFGVARFTVENSVECGDILDACFQGNPPGFDYTRGLFHRGVE